MNNKLAILVTGMCMVPIGCAEVGRSGCGDREVTVNHEAAYLRARPEHVRNICEGNTLTVKLMPPVGAGSARTAPADEHKAQRWLSGSNSAREQIVLVVGPEAEAGRPYKYSITVDGVGTLDPRVTVARR